MQYVLGNMLNGGGINPDGLSLDLQFATDKTLTARRGPTPVFTRSSGDNGGTTYFGPLVDFTEATALSTTGIFNGRASWFKSYEGTDITISYTGTRWRVVTVDDGDEVIYLAAPGSEWRPDQADWSSQGFTITTSSSFGIVKAANNEPRFDHDPITLACKGLLIEEGRTNLLARSEEFDNVYYTAGRASISADQTTSPTGATTADKFITDSSVVNNHRVDRSSVTLALNTVHTISVFAKASEYSGFAIGVDLSVPTIGVQFSLSGSGSVTAQVAGHTGTIQNFGNGWFRCTATFTSSAVSSTHRVYMFLGQNGTTFTYTGDGTSGIFIWGAQLEEGSFPTSYIPTTTGSVVRSADVCSITGGDFNGFYNSTAGTLLSEAMIANLVGDNRGIVQMDNGTNNTIIRNSYGLTDGGFRSTIRANGDSQTALAMVAGTASTIQKRVIAYEGTAFASTTNGGAVATATRTMPTGLNAMKIGNLAEGSFYLSGHIAAIRFYKKRLPNAKIVTLTV
jgi:hypothetical protein